VEKKFLIGITGASGAIYSLQLLKELKKLKVKTELVITDAGKEVLKAELGKSVEDLKSFTERVYDEKEISAPPASGSVNYSGMIVIPCSMATLSAIAHGSSRNLLQRAADVMLKEKRPLILVVRETPLNLIHLKNMCSCAEAGATIFPAMPAFYFKPKSIEELVKQFVKRILNFLGLFPEGLESWNPKNAY